MRLSYTPAFCFVVLAVLIAATGCGSISVTPSAEPGMPQITCAASPSSLPQGGTSLITAGSVGSDNTPLQIQFSSSAGALTVTGSSAVFSSAGVPVGTVTVSCQATNGLGGTSSATADIDIIAPSATSPVAAATTTALTATPSSVVAGSPLTLISQVSSASGTPTGSVTFTDASTPDGSTTLGSTAMSSDGTATLQVSSLTVGNHILVASYAGSPTTAASSSSPVTVVVSATPPPPDPAPAATTTALTATPSAVVAGSPVTLISQVSSASGTPTGSVIFTDASTPDGSTTLGSTAIATHGTATLQVSSLTVGNHILVASYAGNSAMATSVSSPVTVVVSAPPPASGPAPAATTTTLTATPSSVIAGNPVTLTSQTSSASGTPTGSITFTDGSTTLGSTAIASNGTATLSVSSFTVGNHILLATYSGNSAMAASASSPVAVVVSATPPPPVISCSAAPSSINLGDSTTISASASSPENLPVTIAFATSAGSLDASATSAILNTAGAESGDLTVTCTATDSNGETASATAPVWINPGNGEQALTAFNFTDSIGVNVHLHYGNTPYVTDFPDFLTSIAALGIHHYRNGIDPYPYSFEYFNAEALAAKGLKADWIIDVNDRAENINAIYENAPDSIEAFEGPNEDSADAGTTLTDFTQLLYSTVRGNPATAEMPIYPPTLATLASIALQPVLSPWITNANMHDYYDPRNPETAAYGSSFYGCGGYGTMSFNICLANIIAPNLPVVSTETGYVSGPQSDEVIGRYITRTLFFHLENHVMRTYLYEFLDEVNSPGYGLVHSDFTPKPAYTAIQNLVNLFQDGSFNTPGKLDFVLSGQTANLEHVLFQKSDGTWMLALWLGVTSAGGPAPPYPTYTITPQNVSVTTNTPVGAATIYSVGDEGTITSRAATTHNAVTTIPVDDHITILSFSPPSQ